MGIEIEAGTRKFASGLLPELIAAVRRTGQGNLFTIIGSDPRLGEDLTTWCRFTRNTLVETTKKANHTRWVIRCGEAPAESEVDRPVGSRLWLYTNFDCNLRCDYCCVRSSPKAPRRALGLERIKQIAKEAAELGVREIFVTGGEPFLLSNIDETLLACAAAVPTTVLTNGMLLVGWRLEMLRALPRDRITCRSVLIARRPSSTTAIAVKVHGRALCGELRMLDRQAFGYDWRPPCQQMQMPMRSASSWTTAVWRSKIE
jgi:Predicted Fe-S oxidoreductases